MWVHLVLRASCGPRLPVREATLSWFCSGRRLLIQNLYLGLIFLALVGRQDVFRAEWIWAILILEELLDVVFVHDGLR